HSIFIGVMTNALFGLIREASSGRRSFWPWVIRITIEFFQHSRNGCVNSVAIGVVSFHRKDDHPNADDAKSKTQFFPRRKVGRVGQLWPYPLCPSLEFHNLLFN